MMKSSLSPRSRTWKIQCKPSLRYEDVGQTSTPTDKDAEEEVKGLVDNTHSLLVAPGENKTTISLFFDAYAEELAFPSIYLDNQGQQRDPLNGQARRSVTRTRTGRW